MSIRRGVDKYCEVVKESQVVNGAVGLRVPFERSARVRGEALEKGEIEVDDNVYKALVEIVDGGVY
jgi:LDH2 family malate/lactate/ureidoglycolate dehydrogenase